MKTWSLLLLCVASSGLLAWPSPAAPPYTEIVIESGSPYFVPAIATVSAGTPVRWENPTPTHHTVTHNGCIEDGNPCAFDSGTMEPNGTFTIPGLPPGRYAYHCRLHPIMRGVLTVTNPTIAPSQT